MDFPNVVWPPLNVITPYHSDSLGQSTTLIMNGAASSAFTDEVVSYYPFVIRTAAIAVTMTYLQGGTQSGNVDLGIYTSTGGLIVSSGLIAQTTGTINTLHDVGLTDTLLTPGFYYMAIKCTSGTGTAFMRNPADEIAQSTWPMFQETTGANAALPTAATFASTTITTPPLIVMGVHFSTLL